MNAPVPHLTANETGNLETHVDAVSLGLQALAVLLVRERQALTDRASPEVLDNIAVDKQAAVANVAGLYALLRESLEGLGEDGTDLADSVSSLKRAHPHLAGRVDQLVALTRECQIANQENGVLVNARLNGTRGALRSLQDATIGSDPVGTYGPVGASLGALAGDRLTVRA